MFSFLYPMFLWAAAAAVIPLILHMMRKRRIVRVPFSTIRFLKQAEKRCASRVRLENFLLWLLRTFLMLLLALAFAMPMLRTKAFGRFLSTAQRDVAIVLDGSYSMNYNTGRDTVWSKALESAIAIVNGLEDGDQVCVFLANDDVKPVVAQLTPDREFAVTQLKALEPGTTSSQLCPATIAAYDSLKQEARRREREIHIITDGQALPWNSFGKAEGGKDKVDMDKRTALFVTLTGVPAPENVAPLDIELQPKLIMSDMPCKVKVKLGYSGPVQDSIVSIYVDNREVASRATTIGDESFGDIMLTVPPLEPGTHAARIETPPDNLPLDNNFHFLIRAKKKLPTLCAGTKGDTLYLMKALTASLTSTSAMDVKLIEAVELAGEALSTYSCIFLCNALPLQGQAILQIEQYVRAGGLLVIFPGNRATLSDYETWTCLPGLPSAVEDIHVSSRKKMLRWEKPRHPLLRTLGPGPGGAPVITVRRQLGWEKLHEAGESLISAGAENPFLLSRSFGNGQVLILSVSADRSWSNFPLSPFFLPLTHQAVQFGAGIVGARPYLWATRSLSLAEHLPAATQGSTLLNPDEENVPIRSSIVDSKTLLCAENLVIPGVYLLAGTASAEREPALAINIDRTESNLIPVKKDDIPGIIGRKNVYIAGDKEELMRLVKEYRVGQTLGESLLWLVFILALVEVFYANQKAKLAPSLSDALGIEASGKVAGKARG